MAYYKQKTTVEKRCIRHGCTNQPTWRVATSNWWKLHFARKNDGRTGIVFGCCDEHIGAGWKPVERLRCHNF